MFKAAILAASLLAGLPAWGMAPNVVGTWQTEGYGQAFNITSTGLNRYQTTQISCIGDVTAARADQTQDVPRYLGTKVNGDTGATWEFTFFPGTDADHVVMHVAGAISDILLRRVDTLPPLCGQRQDRSQLHSFDIFAATFAENYPFFALHGVDWAQVVADHRRHIKNNTTLAGFFHQLRNMLAPLQDAHTGFGLASAHLSYSGFKPPAPISPANALAARKIINTAYLTKQLTGYCNNQLEFGMLARNIGYLRLNSFSNFGSSPLFSDQIATLEAALDAIFSSATGMRGLVIDVRINGGGADQFGVLLAGRLTQSTYLAYSKIYRNNPDNPHSFGPAQPFYVTPSNRPGFAGPVALLIGHNSVSAAETFPMALQGHVPPIPFVGENTQGVFSDVLIRHLPNGFGFGLPNEIYLTQSGVAYDVVGVPPSVRVPVFTKADLAAHRDRALEAAMDLVAGGAR